MSLHDKKTHAGDILFYSKIHCFSIKSIYMNTKTPCTDHNGITYESITEMCDAFGVTPTLYLKRIERGWSVKEAFEGKQPYFSRDGKDYYSQKEVCDEFKIHRKR